MLRGFSVLEFRFHLYAFVYTNVVDRMFVQLRRLKFDFPRTCRIIITVKVWDCLHLVWSEVEP
jgi:hypothetical protein